MLALWALAACWQPDPWTPPPPPPEALEAMGVGVLDEAALAAGEAGVPEEDAEEGAVPEGGSEPTNPEEDASGAGIAAVDPPVEADPDAFDVYPARVVAVPATIVDDFGKPLFVILTPDTPVEVRAEEPPVRKRVWCARCEPPVEGWLQDAVVERVPVPE
jgi:hypothetical protein